MARIDGINVNLDDRRALMAAMRYKATHIKAKADPELFAAVADALAGSRPDVRGHWEISCDGYYPFCSACKTEPKSGIMTDFCPSCGADMRGNRHGTEKES